MPKNQQLFQGTKSKHKAEMLNCSFTRKGLHMYWTSIHVFQFFQSLDIDLLWSNYLSAAALIVLSFILWQTFTYHFSKLAPLAYLTKYWYLHNPNNRPFEMLRAVQIKIFLFNLFKWDDGEIDIRCCYHIVIWKENQLDFWSKKDPTQGKPTN